MAVKEEDEDEKLDEKTIDFLDDVKKGKPRKFAMICKGAKIVSLVVYKKGSLEKYKKQAKEQGKGVFYHGVVDGKGVNINFKLARADGFDKAPGPPAGLKAFLADKADLKVMPLYEIVDEIGPVLDADDPLTARFLKLQTAALEACDAHPDKAEQINALCLEIGKLIDAEDAVGAEGQISKLEHLLDGLAPDGPEPMPTATPPKAPPLPPKPVVDERQKEFMERLTNLKPDLQEAKSIASSLPKESQTKVDEAAAQAKEAGGLAQKKKYDEAFDLLGQAEKGLAEALASAGDLEAQCEALKNAVYPQVKPAVAAAPLLKEELVSLLNEASKHEKAGAFVKAIAAYQQLDRKIKQALAGQKAFAGDGAGGLSVMKLGKARLEWVTTRDDAFKSMADLKVAFEKAYENKPKLKGEVAAALKKLDASLAVLSDDLHKQLDDVLKEADPNKRSSLAEVARKTMKDFVAHVETDDVMLNLDGNEILPETRITAPIYAKLQEIAVALG